MATANGTLKPCARGEVPADVDQAGLPEPASVDTQPPDALTVYARIR
jgi:hypothetical protein